MFQFKKYVSVWKNMYQYVSVLKKYKFFLKIKVIISE